MYQRAVSFTRAFVLMVGPTLKCSYQNLATNLTKSVEVPHQSAFTSSSSSSSLRNGFKKITSSGIVRHYQAYDKRKYGLGLGFSLSFLGFFKKEEELSVEDKILMEMKRAILAIQVRDFKVESSKYEMRHVA